MVVDFAWEVKYNETRKILMEGTQTGGSLISAGLINSIGNAMRQIGGGALYEEGTRIMNESLNIVPVEWGNLQNTGTVHDPEETEGNVTVMLSYGGPAVDYAIVQHETPPDVFSHSPGQSWKYLQRPAEEATRGMEQRIAADIRARLAREM